MSYEHVEVAREGALTIVTINRPASHNALHSLAQRELAEVFDDFATDDGSGSPSSPVPARKLSARDMT